MSKRKGRDGDPPPRDEEDSNGGNSDQEGRRGFLEKAAAMGVGAVAGLAPFAAGAYTFLDPLRTKSRPGEAAPPTGDETPGKWVQVARLANVTAGAPPRHFQVITDSWDAWNYYPPHPVGGVYLARDAKSDAISAFTATCPHLGCSVKFQSGTNTFACPCHDSVFTPDGKKLPQAVSPRDMDSLEVEVRDGDGGQEVWVKFVKFRTGKTEKLPEA
jgi:Rieske Fe-S protein